MPKKEKRIYRCLTGITDDLTNKRWEIGDMLVDGDLDPEVIEAFLSNDPPILEVVENEVING